VSWHLRVDAAPPRWRRTQLRSFLARSRKKGRPDLPLLSVNLPDGVVLRREGDGRPAAAEDLSAYQVVRRGDLVMNQLGKPHGALGVSEHDGIISPAYFVARIGGIADARFVHHMLRTRLYVREYERRGKFMPPSQFDISWDQFRTIPVALPPLSEQRAIADFLDTETARIDGLITKKHRLIDLLDERFHCWLDELLGCSQRAGLSKSGPWPWVPLRRVATVHGGLTLGKAYDHGRPHPYVRVANVQDRRLDLAEVSTVDVPPEVAARFALRTGDVLMLEGNGNPENLGRGTIWRGEIDGCLHQNHVHAVRVDQRRITPEYLDWVVRTAWARWIFSGASAQVSIATLSQQQILDLAIPLPPTPIQARLVSEAEAAHRRLLRVTSSLSRQIGLLQEHRQALITAAVTGELDVPGVAA
jgi:type I restriction enzyme S subunit